MPSIKLAFDSPLHGGTDDSVAELTLRYDASPMSELIRPRPHANVNVVVYEYDAASDNFRVLYRGIVTRATVKPGGVDGIVKLKIAGSKSKLGLTVLGMPALSTCIWAFGNENQSPCGKDIAANTYTGAITTMNVSGHPTRIVFTFDGDPPDLNPLRFDRGYVTVDGLRITTRRYVSDDAGSPPAVTFDLREIPPDSWAGQPATITSGCNQTIDNCRFWANESQFMGYGIAMQPRNPMFEE